MSTGLSRLPSWGEIKGVYGRRRRSVRKAMLEPVLVGWPVLREIVTNALAARGHLVLCDLGDVRFFVDPSDRVVGAWLMWHGGWQRREIVTAVDVLLAAGRLHAQCGVRRYWRAYRHAHRSTPCAPAGSSAPSRSSLRQKTSACSQ